MSKLTKVLPILIAVAIIGALVYWFFIRDTAEYKTIEEVVYEEQEQSAENIDDENQFDEKTDENQEKPKKTPTPPTTVNVTEPPLVYTGYGHSEEDPLKLEQQTSTTCTTVPGAACYIKFVSGNDTAILQSKTTDEQGVVVWNWLGKEVGSGTWTVTAVAGGIESSIETIYIQ